ncbi:hypothetical protein [Dactylosporangium sp. CA-233914]|uniref:hypothetical protein n=1 Tax=Dactylosporangium sp. CA-233914 TaxID=3239934 RepID=UPI003D8EC2D6
MVAGWYYEFAVVRDVLDQLDKRSDEPDCGKVTMVSVVGGASGIGKPDPEVYSFRDLTMGVCQHVLPAGAVAGVGGVLGVQEMKRRRLPEGSFT